MKEETPTQKIMGKMWDGAMPPLFMILGWTYLFFYWCFKGIYFIFQLMF